MSKVLARSEKDCNGRIIELRFGYKTILQFQLVDLDKIYFDLLLTEFNKLHNAYQTMKASENFGILNKIQCMRCKRKIERIVSRVINDTNDLTEKGISEYNFVLCIKALERLKIIRQSDIAKYIGEDEIWEI